MLPLRSASSASTSSLLASASPTSEPSKYIAQVPLVAVPSVVGVNAKTSSSAPVTPATDELPVVESNTRPSGSKLTESIFSAVISRPTSIPFKYMPNVPAVTLPSEVASNLAISVGANVILPIVTDLSKAIRNVSASMTEKANTSVPLTPTSEPSKSILQLEPSNFRMSSSEKETPPTLPLLVNEAYRGLLEGGKVAVAVIVEVAVREGVAVLLGVKVCEGVNVAVAVGVLVGVPVAVGEGPGVGVAVFVGVKVGEPVFVGVRVTVAVGVFVRVGVAVLVAVDVGVPVVPSESVSITAPVRVMNWKVTPDELALASIAPKSLL